MGKGEVPRDGQSAGEGKAAGEGEAATVRYYAEEYGGVVRR